MTLAGFLLGLFVALAASAVAHLVTDGGLGRLLLYLVLGQAAFWAGHLAGTFGWLAFGKVGVVWLGTGLLSQGLVLAIAALLSGPPRSAAETDEATR